MQNCGEIDDAQLAGGHRSRCGIHAARRCSATLPSLVPQVLAGLAKLAASIVDDAPHSAVWRHETFLQITLESHPRDVACDATVDTRVNKKRACVARFFFVHVTSGRLRAHLPVLVSAVDAGPHWYSQTPCCHLLPGRLRGQTSAQMQSPPTVRQ